MVWAPSKDTKLLPVRQRFLEYGLLQARAPLESTLWHGMYTKATSQVAIRVIHHVKRVARVGQLQQFEVGRVVVLLAPEA